MGRIFATHNLTLQTAVLGAAQDITASHPAPVSSTGTTDVQTIAVPMDASMVLLSAETNDVLVRIDGTAAAIGGGGIPIRAGASAYYCPLLPQTFTVSGGATTRKPLSFVSMSGTGTLRAVFGQ